MGSEERGHGRRGRCPRPPNARPGRLAVWPSGRLTSDSRLLVAALSLAAATLIPAPAVRAQACEVPAAVSVERGPATAEAAPRTPEAGPAVIRIEGEDESAATPAALAAATPLATPTPDPLETLAAELTAVAEALAACLSAGEAETVAQLAGERYLGQLFGSSVPFSAEEYVAVASELTPIPTRIVRVEEVAREREERATAIVTQIVGNQLMRAAWTFEPAPAAERPAARTPWQLAGERQLPAPAPGDASPVAVEIGDRSFTLDQSRVAGPDVVLRGDNVSNEDHEMLVLRLAPGYTTTDLVRATGPDLPREVTFIGEQPVLAGGTGELALVALEPGEYTLVCLFPDAQGTPHLAQGMEATFTVE